MSNETTEEIEIKFGFDPFQSETLKPIVNDPIAFSLWAMWKRNHIVSNLFLQEVIRVAEMVKARCPDNAESLLVCFPTFSHDFTSGDVCRFVTEWLEVLSGAKNLYMIINGDRYHCEMDSAAVKR
jgi:hypothetical protein